MKYEDKSAKIDKNINLHNIINKKYNINFDLKLDSFYNFIDSLKESKKYYSDYCKTKNILKSELLKLYIFITNDDSDDQYIIVDDTIKYIHEFLLAQSVRRFYTSQSEKIAFWSSQITFKLNNNKYELNNIHTIPDLDQDFINSIYINYLTRNKLSKLIRHHQKLEKILINY